MAGKVAVFGMLKRGGKVYVKIVPDTKIVTLMSITIRKIAPVSIVYINGYRSYNTIDVSDFSHHRIIHSEKFV